MKTLTAVSLSLVILLFVGSFTIALYFMGTLNTQNGLAVRYQAQTKVVETTMDTMRKTLMNQYGVHKDVADTFIKVAALKAGGHSGGSLFKSVTEASGNTIQGFSPEVAMKMMTSIEGKMDEFKRSQETWVDVWRQHHTYVTNYPQALWLSGKAFPEPKIITSSTAKAAMLSGELGDDILGRKETKAEKGG